MHSKTIRLVLCLIAAALLLTGCKAKILPFEGKKLSDGQVGASYETSIATGTADMYYDLDDDSNLPKGMILYDDGVIKGIPEQAGTFDFKAVMIDLDDNEYYADFALYIEPGKLIYTGRSLTDGTTGEPYQQALNTASGSSDIVYAVKEGTSLPAGLVLSADGMLSGIPEEAGEQVTLTVTATAPGCDPADAAFTLNIAQGAVVEENLGHIEFAKFDLPDAIVGQPYSESVRKAYGVPNITYSFRFSGGQGLPAGLDRDKDLGLVLGTPVDSTNGKITFKVTAEAEGYEAVTVKVTLNVVDPYVATTRFETEYVNTIPKLTGNGYSDSKTGRGMIQNTPKASNGRMLGYDYSGKKLPNGGYILERGDYTLYVARNAHDRAMAIPFKVETDVVYKAAAAENDEVENRFADVSDHIESYLSRSDWNATFPTTPTEDDKTVDNAFMNQLTLEAYIGSGSKIDADKPWYADRKPRQKRKQLGFDDTEYKLYQLIGKDYNDPLWDKLLNQLTYTEMRYLIGTGNFNTAAMENIDKPKTTDPDGPAGFTNFMTVIGGTATVYDTCFYASECVIAATWNVELVEEMGNAVGNEALIGNERGDGRSYNGWYGPAVNIHRTPFSGRNWEYYSEDGFLSGKMAASVIKGANSKGVYTYVKHFAVNDQETNRDTNGLITWVNEQALREIYLKPFEFAVKEGGTHAMMSSFNRIGTVWAGGNYALLTDVLRNEWGFVGMVITDYNTNGYMYADQMIRAGGDLNLIQDKQPSASGDVVTASHQSAIRRAAKNILYTVVNSNAMNGMGEGIVYDYAMPYWKMALIALDVIMALIFAAWGFCSIRKSMRKVLS